MVIYEDYGGGCAEDKEWLLILGLHKSKVKASIDSKYCIAY
jgi:hypothetical protein